MKKLILISLVCSALYSSAQSYFGIKPIVNEPTCYGSTNGSIQLSLLGGTAPYQYNWGNSLPAGTTVQNNVGAGSYSVTVTDANNLTTSYTIVIAQPFQIQINETHNAPQTHGASNGSIATTVDGGTPNYTYLWSNGQTTADIIGLPAGNYTLTVTDEAGCTATATQTLTQPNVVYHGPMVSMDGGQNNPRTLSVSNDNSNTAAASNNLPKLAGAELKSADVQVYPNPASSVVTLKTGDVTGAEISVIDINGQTVSKQIAESNETNVNVSGLQKGNYIIEIKTADGSVVTKTVDVVR